MAVKLPDTLVPMADFPSAFAKDVQFTDGENLQDKLDKGKLGSSSGGTGLTEEQANNIEKIPSIEGIVTSNSQAIENKADKDHEHTEYLKEIPDEYVTDTKLSTELDKKVDKEVGKGLSTNDLTNELVTKINSSATEAFVTNAIANAQLDDKEVDLSGYATVDALNLKADLTHTHDEYLTKVPDEYITETELTAKGYLTEHQDISNLQTKSDNNLTTTSKEVVGAINEISGTQLDTVSFSADYKNIILNRKSGLNPYTIPIASIINNTSLTELKDIDSTDIGNGKTLIYDGATGKHKYVGSTGTDELVKMNSTTDAHYLADLIDKSTIVNEDGILKVKMLDGQDVTISEINHLKGLTMNVMDLVNAFANGGVKVLNTPLNTASELSTMDRSAFIDGISYIVYVLSDENHAGAKTTYLVDKTNATFFGNADSQRNFTTDPLNLANEVTGKLGTSNIDVDSLWSLLTIDNNYKTPTTTDNVFGTRGAKEMYNELIADIGVKVNKDVFDTHIGDTSIHITQDEKDSYVKKTEVLTNDNAQHIRRFYSVPGNDWDNAIEEGYYSIAFDSVANKIENRPHDYAIQVHVIKADTNDAIFIYQIAYVSISDTRIYIRKQKIDYSWTPWGRICTTTVADVGKTTITPASSNITGTIKYTVKNGICYVSFKSVQSKVSATFSISTTMPKPDISCNIGIISDVSNYITGYAYIDENTTKLNAIFYNTNSTGSCSFSYPVAE